MPPFLKPEQTVLIALLALLFPVGGCTITPPPPPKEYKVLATFNTGPGNVVRALRADGRTSAGGSPGLPSSAPRSRRSRRYPCGRRKRAGDRNTQPTLNVQPVIPFRLTEGRRVVTRSSLSVIHVPDPGDTTGFGDLDNGKKPDAAADWVLRTPRRPIATANAAPQVGRHCPME